MQSMVRACLHFSYGGWSYFVVVTWCCSCWAFFVFVCLFLNYDNYSSVNIQSRKAVLI